VVQSIHHISFMGELIFGHAAPVMPSTKVTQTWTLGLTHAFISVTRKAYNQAEPRKQMGEQAAIFSYIKLEPARATYPRRRRS